MSAPLPRPAGQPVRGHERATSRRGYVRETAHSAASGWPPASHQPPATSPPAPGESRPSPGPPSPPVTGNLCRTFSPIGCSSRRNRKDGTKVQLRGCSCSVTVSAGVLTLRARHAARNPRSPIPSSRRRDVHETTTTPVPASQGGGALGLPQATALMHGHDHRNRRIRAARRARSVRQRRCGPRRLHLGTVGALLLAVVFGALSKRVKNSEGGPYAFARESFGELRAS